MTHQEIIARAAKYVTPEMMADFGIGWLVHATYQAVGAHRNPAFNADYYPRKAFSDWFSPAEYRNDGMLVSETASERGLRIGAEATRKAMLAFAA